MILLIASSCYIWSVIIKKCLFFSKTFSAAKEFKRYVESMPKLKRLIVEDVSMHFQIYDAAFDAHMKDNLEKIDVTAQEIEQKWSVVLEKDLNYLSTIGMISPFIGLFGTVWGIMNSFQSIATCNSTSIAIVAPGISEALFATAVGLFVAIPATVASHIFYGKIDEISKDLHIFTNYVKNKLSGEKNA